ncbi:UDP-N-acetylmuramoyl-L-alanyl-D-glutamate--2,6-diaminopimelate ligase [Pelagibacterium lentulum]|uniref:UDP-N-acetylmuramoyl-L-alanyl-D-glutamate--2,6-diaminopimelate ligase n=2 Tax=Pelagibacterium lentulum TaxID=2029865 RepID=A0A916VWE7_9HYPH|nr:UDP-N-acetylmuramoyl-L-alanyl-D-glutamate--2,6-diaminopimelate ligase [Pelagibacterium lentulum]GGA46685.1 UDP-N-acetylmuramoyl-L-alanyl-D-glutamate--2,6-diaminopimelate ligase [Pelagibacterium lentulum]
MTMPFSVATLLDGMAKVSPDVSASGLCADSRLVGEGDVFFALPGTRAHGNAFAKDAVARGAVAVVTDIKPELDLDAPVILVDDVRMAYARAAAKACGPQPTHCVAVTGTNGKTSVVTFLRQIWDYAGLKGASLGTLGLMVGDEHIPGELTTPDALSLHKTLAQLKSDGVDYVAMEASSHGIDQRRLDGVKFEAVAFTNLSRDHLDYHADMDAYRDAKLRLFRELIDDSATAVIDAENEEGMAFMFAALDRGATVFTVGAGGAHIDVESVEVEGFGQRVKGKLVGEPLDFHLPLVGRFQVDNAVVAAGLAMATGVENAVAIAALEHLKGAKGRLELAGKKGDGAVFVDYSHKPEALRVALETLRPSTKGKLIVVFGCGGDRDAGKRPQMGAIASELADVAIVTDDNPRTEDAASIRAQVMAAAKGATEIGDRAEAIHHAIAIMEPDDTVLVAGKGHEDYQIIGKTKHHFSDHEVVREALGN